MRVRITGGSRGMPFPYGHLSPADRQFVLDTVGCVFEAERANMNYYRLWNGRLVHIYNAMEVPDVPTENTPQT